jgi:hypothetical protein
VKVDRRYVWAPAMIALVLAALAGYVWIDNAKQEPALRFSVRSKEQLLNTMRSDPYFMAIERRFPDVAIDAVERGWRVKELGGNDSEVSNAMRKAVVGIYPILVAQADDASLEKFATLIVEQAKAARALSYEACGKLLESELNIAATLPAEYFQREQAWVTRALEAVGNDAARRSPRVIEAALGVLRSALPPEQLPVLANPGAYRERPGVRCDAAIALYDAALALPADDKAAALEGLLKR